MKKNIIISTLSIIMILTLLPTSIFAETTEKNTNKQPSLEMKYYDNDGNVINDENQFSDISDYNKSNIKDHKDEQVILKQSDIDTLNQDGSSSPRLLAPGPVLKSWKSYTVNSSATTTITKFKKICEATVDNRKATKGNYLDCNITRSDAVGSSWNVSLSTSYEDKILAKVGASYTKTKAKNAAVGLTDRIWVPKGKQGKITAHYKGHKTSGYITYNLIQNNRIIGTSKQNTTQTNHFKTLNVHFDKSVY